MEAAADILKDFGIPFEARVLSAHRTPDKMTEWAQKARERGMRVIIAGAGGAAHLPGMIAASTVLPVIGVPVETRSLKGLDSLLSIVQMPGGVPVATVAIGNAKNAALLAVQILGAGQEHHLDAMETYRATLRAQVADMDAAVRGMKG